MTTGEVGRFDWVHGSGIGTSCCVTWVETADLAAVAAAFGGHVDAAGPLRLADVPDRYGDQPAVAMFQAGGWVIAIELTGSEGTRPEVLRRASSGARAVSAWWTVDALTRFSYAVDGRVLVGFEAVSPQWRDGADPDRLERLRAGLPWESADPV